MAGFGVSFRFRSITMDAGCGTLLGLVAVAAFVVAVVAIRKANRAAAESEELRKNLSDLHAWVRQSWQPQPQTAPEPSPVAMEESRPAPVEDSRPRLSE